MNLLCDLMKTLQIAALTEVHRSLTVVISFSFQSTSVSFFFFFGGGRGGGHFLYVIDLEYILSPYCATVNLGDKWNLLSGTLKQSEEF